MKNAKNTVKKGFFSYTRMIALGFAALILLGSLLLKLPFASASGESAPYVNCLFTSVSATCVTGLVVYDTFTQWTLFGQIVIITLIQIGGLGFMTVITLFSFFMGRRIGLGERRLLMESTGSLNVGGIVAQIKKVLLGTLIFEFAGACLLSIRFIGEFGVGKGIYYSVFHSISAFCNAGFDLMGVKGEFSSLTSYVGDPLINITVCMLIIVGGIGFIVWDDVVKHGLKLKKYQLHSKIVLTTSAILIVIPAVLFYVFERNGVLAGMPFGKALLASFFGVVSPRTAGFATVDLAQLSPGASLLTMVLMLIGGSPGSTAGGIKTTTLFVLVVGMVATARGKENVNAFKKRLEDGVIRKASAIFTVYILMVVVFTLVICMFDSHSLKDILFEAISAVGTVGLTTGITPTLSSVAKILLMVLMFAGRVGGLSLVLALAEKRMNAHVERPVEKIIIG
ncbi:MAG: Trk family potassium uptake protein [Clostridiales bacterium]|nr:Trk family potassium uptake protein [Clostridiales bacterium]